MNNLFMLPPLTASYMDNMGPKITLAYEEIIRKAYHSPNLLVPWNSGGRKFERDMGADYDDLFLKIEECKKKYQTEGLLPEKFYESTELDFEFKNIVFETLYSKSVKKERQTYSHCPKCNKKKLSMRSEICLTCETDLESIIETEELLRFDTDKIYSAISLSSIHPHELARFTHNENDYLLKVFRESNLANHWSMGERTFNQRFVSIHWPKYAHKKYGPNRLHIFCGETIRYKWLLPSLCLLSDQELKRTDVYIHGTMKKGSFMEHRIRPEYASLALSSTNLGGDINIGGGTIKRIQKMKRKIDNITNFLENHALVSDIQSDTSKITEIMYNIDCDFSKGQNRKALDWVNTLIRLISNDLIPFIKSNGIKKSDLQKLRGAVEYVKRYYN